MNAKKQLSPEKYITTRARNLPIYKCLVTHHWEKVKMGTAVVIRQHVNGNFTAALFLVDLLCLGVKDSLYYFNIAPEKFYEKIDIDAMNLIDADYNTVHNIIYAAHDFAAEFDIAPHKNFAVSKYILEEDDDNIPLIEIEVGDEHGNPHLMEGPSFKFGPVLKKLEAKAGKGNYSYNIGSEEDFFNEGDNIDFDDPSEGDRLSHIDFDAFDFPDARLLDTYELEETIAAQSRSNLENVLIETELLLRKLNDQEPNTILSKEEVKALPDYQMLLKGLYRWQEAYRNARPVLEEVWSQFREVITQADDEIGEEIKVKFFKYLEERPNEESTFILLNVFRIPFIPDVLDRLLTMFDRLEPAPQVLVAAFAAARGKDDDVLQFIYTSSNVEEAYPSNKNIHGMHHKFFWVVQALNALRANDKEKLLHYHNLLRFSGTGGSIKFIYAIQLHAWLKAYLGLKIMRGKLNSWK